MSQQLVKKGANGGMVNVNPKSWIEAIKDKNTGQTLVEILQGFNMYFLPYNGNTSATRCLVPTMLRKKGLWITYVKYDGNVYTEWYAADELDDKSWEDSSNWRIGNNTLVGDITISANSNWVINGTETEFKAVGEKGNTPLLRVANNRLQVSYDLGDTYRDVTNNPVYTKFRWLATTGDTQANNVGRIQASTDEGKTWTNMSNDFTNNLHIKKYIGVNESLPTSGIAEGTIYAKGPYYAEDDTLNDNPIYRLWVYAWKGNTLAWQDNGEFQSIAAGVVQETGGSETKVMSQKAVTEKLSELGSKLITGELSKSYSGIYVYGETEVKEATSRFDSYIIKISKDVNKLYTNTSSAFLWASLFYEYPQVGGAPSAKIDSHTDNELRILDIPKHNNESYVVITISKEAEHELVVLSESHKNRAEIEKLDSKLSLDVKNVEDSLCYGLVKGEFQVNFSGLYIYGDTEVRESTETYDSYILRVPNGLNVLYTNLTSAFVGAYIFKDYPQIGDAPTMTVESYTDSFVRILNLSEHEQDVYVAITVNKTKDKLSLVTESYRNRLEAEKYYSEIGIDIENLRNDFYTMSISGEIINSYSGLYVYGETEVRSATDTFDSYIVKVSKDVNTLYTNKTSAFVYANYFNEYPKVGDYAVGSLDTKLLDSSRVINLPNHDGTLYVLITINKTNEERLSILSESNRNKAEIDKIIGEVIYDYRVDSSELLSQLDQNGWLTENGEIEYPIAKWVNGYVDIGGAVSLEISHVYNTQSYMCAFIYDESKQNILYKFNISNDTKYVILPNGSKYLRMCLWLENNNEFYLKTYRSDRLRMLENKVKENSDKIEDILKVDTPKIIAPNDFYGVLGYDLNIYYDTLVKAKDNGLLSPDKYYVDIDCPVLHERSYNDYSIRQDRMWQLYTTESNRNADITGVYDLYIRLYDEKYNLIDSKVSKLHIIKAQGFTTNKNILCIGDSITNNGELMPTIKENFEKVGGIQPTFIGTRSSGGVHHEGYPGYTFYRFVNKVDFKTYVFQVALTANVAVKDEYMVEGIKYTVTDVRIENETTKSVRCDGSGTPSNSGIMVFRLGDSNSDKEIEYSSLDIQGATPFFNESTNSVDIANYRAEVGMGNSKFDGIVIMLGCNDSLWEIKNMQDSVNYAKTLIDALLQDAENYPTKIILQLPPLDANTISSWQVYRDDDKVSQKVAYQTNIWELRKLIYEVFTSSEYKGKVYIGQASLGIDRYYGYPYKKIKSCSRINVEEVYHTNSVHPNKEGYQQYGDGYFLQLLGLIPL